MKSNTATGNRQLKLVAPVKLPAADTGMLICVHVTCDQRSGRVHVSKLPLVYGYYESLCACIFLCFTTAAKFNCRFQCRQSVSQ